MHAQSGTLQQKLRKVRPHYVLVYLRDEEEPKRVNVQTTSTVRTKIVLETIRDLDWTKVEMFDSKGGLLGVHPRNADDETPAGGLEDLNGGGLAQSTKMSEVAAFAQILTRANDQVADRQVRLIQPLLDAFVQVVNVTVRRLDATNEDLDRERERVAAQQSARERDMLRMLREAADKAAEASEGGADSTDMFAQLMPAVMAAVLAPKEAPAPAKSAPAADASTGASNAAAAAKSGANGHAKKRSGN